MTILITLFIDLRSPLTRFSWENLLFYHDQDIFYQYDLVMGHPKLISTEISIGQRYNLKWPQHATVQYTCLPNRYGSSNALIVFRSFKLF